MFQIAKHTSRVQQAVNLRIERLLPFMHKVMNRKTRNHRVKFPETGKRRIHVVLDHCHK